MAVLAWVCFDENQDKVYQQVVSIQLSSPLLMGARALLEASKWAVNKEIKCLSIFTDCKVLVNSFEQICKLDWLVNLVVQDILSLSKYFVLLCVAKVN